MSHARACMHAHSHHLSRMHSSRRFPCCRCAQTTHTHTSARRRARCAATEDLPRKWPSFIFSSSPCYLGWRGGEAWAKLLKIQSYRGVGATAEVKQSESCRQSFNLKRTRSPWGARGAGRIKKFNNSMFYGPRKWDLSTGAGWGSWELAVWSVHRRTKQPDTKKQKRSAAECWVELMTPSPGLKYTAATASRQRRRERGQQIKPRGVACSLSFTVSLLSVTYSMHGFAIFPHFCLCPATFHSNVSLENRHFLHSG